MTTSTATTRAVAVGAARFTGPLFRRIAFCVALTALNAIVIGKFAGVLYRATVQHPIEQTEVMLLFATLFGSLARTWLFALARHAR